MKLTKLEKAVYEYLDALRETGVTNMYGAGPYVAEAFDMDKAEAHEHLNGWMKTFKEREEHKMLEHKLKDNLKWWQDRVERTLVDLEENAQKEHVNVAYLEEDIRQLQILLNGLARNANELVEELKKGDK